MEDRLNHLHCKQCIDESKEKGKPYTPNLRVATNGTHIIIYCRNHENNLVGSFELKNPIPVKYTEEVPLLKRLQDGIRAIRLCEACRLRQGCKLPVPYAGNLLSNIVWIGRDPGETEDENNFPFVGESGQLLSWACTEAGFNIWMECYITNTIKCRPKNNTAPPLTAYKFCFEKWLARELFFKKAPVVVILGKEALSTVLPGMKLKHGEVYEHTSGAKFYHLYHPSFWCRNGKKTYAEKEVVPILKEWYKEWGEKGLLVRPDPEALVLPVIKEEK